MRIVTVVITVKRKVTDGLNGLLTMMRIYP